VTFCSNSNKYGFGVYVSLVGKDSYASYTSTTDGIEYYNHKSDIYGAGVSSPIL